jgi:hypothetical protein
MDRLFFVEETLGCGRCNHVQKAFAFWKLLMFLGAEEDVFQRRRDERLRGCRGSTRRILTFVEDVIGHILAVTAGEGTGFFQRLHQIRFLLGENVILPLTCL